MVKLNVKERGIGQIEISKQGYQLTKNKINSSTFICGTQFYLWIPVLSIMHKCCSTTKYGKEKWHKIAKEGNSGDNCI